MKSQSLLIVDTPDKGTPIVYPGDCTPDSIIRMHEAFTKYLLEHGLIRFRFHPLSFTLGVLVTTIGINIGIYLSGGI
jgi:hypothetical protein